MDEALENASIARLVQERLGGPDRDRLRADEFLRGIGMERYVERLPDHAR